MCAGALMLKATGTGADGVHEGHEGKALTLFNYTGRAVVGLKAWKKARLTEMARVKLLGGRWKSLATATPCAAARTGRQSSTPSFGKRFVR